MKPIGLILSAGLGQRLRPLTEFWPKPLIPFLGTTPLALAVKALLNFGIEEIWINTHYKASDFPQYINILPNKVYLKHEPDILGTGGALNFLREKLNSRNALIINGDVIADFNLECLYQTHINSGAIATMMLLKDVIPGETPVWHDERYILGIQREPLVNVTPSNFACAQIITPQFLELLPKLGAFDIINFGYRKALSEKLPIAYSPHNGFWSDIGSIESYYKTMISFVTGSPHFPRWKLLESLNINETRRWHSLPPILEGSSILDATKVSSNSKFITSSFVDEKAHIEFPCEIRNSIVLPGGFVQKNQKVISCIVGPFGTIDTKNLNENSVATLNH